MRSYQRVHNFTNVFEVEGLAVAQQLAHNLIKESYWFACAPMWQPPGCGPILAFEFMGSKGMSEARWKRVMLQQVPEDTVRAPSHFTVKPAKERDEDVA